MPSLATELFREIRPGLFRVLAGSNAAVYVDVLDILEREASERHLGITREEAMTIVGEVIARHPLFTPEDPELERPATDQFSALPLREKARRVLDYLAKPEIGWVLDEQLHNWDRVIRLDAHGVILIDAIRKIARPDAAVFTDKLQGVCVALTSYAEFANAPFVHLENCLTLARGGLTELRGIEKTLLRLMERQRQAATLGDIYGVVFDQYTEQVGRTCYAELVRAQLPTRLDEAHARIRVLQSDVDLLHKMQHEVMRRDGLDSAMAMSRARMRLDELARTIELVQPLADEIDRRTAEFARRSLARSRYLQEVVGARRSQIKDMFERINGALAGCRLAELNQLISLPRLSLPDGRLLAGRDSLYEPPRRRSLEENPPIDDDVSEAQRDLAKAQLRAVARESLTVARANRFVEKLAGGKGARIASADLPVENKDDVADVIAVLLHADSSDARYRVEVSRINGETAISDYDRKLDCSLERFCLIKK